ncbi:NAD(P)/FAD-dependent oxidoreductase [Neptunicella marina]|uniref:FAD-dependent oxidoreductase n=1 Tax=Neptunicella marina TaxID=2125989 RepID=A0A8J6IS63_9ALTE|nr:FAD-dependent oxidoreductase [Neptunicella marina]MBC3764428.1 FAD-dependent oxidoreductase [Neptunicella marina]
MTAGKKIAVVGSGISGLTAGYLLSKKHQVSLFEANDYLGGHTHTEQIEIDDTIYPVNTGFIVFNDRTYPNFIRLMDEIGIKSETSNMSFSVRCENTGLEYSGTSLNSLFAQRRNLLRPAFWKMVADILRFNRDALAALEKGDISASQTVGEFLQQGGYGRWFQDYYIIPMGAAIWSASFDMMRDFPLLFFLRFFKHHGLLSINNRPVWHVLTGGSSSYVEPLIAPFRQNVHINCAVKTIERDKQGVTLCFSDGHKQQFDEVVLACHSDQALSMLAQPTMQEQAVLGAIGYQENDVVLHTDRRFMPNKDLAWASWNYHLPQYTSHMAMLTYYMNLLQNFECKTPILVTLNRTQDIDPAKILKQYRYSHPVFTLDAMDAQQRFSQINNQQHTHYCGAYWFNGFHEDGVNSAIRVVKQLGIDW